MIDTKFRPVKINSSSIFKFNSEELNEEKRKCKNFIDRTYKKEVEELENIIVGINKSLLSAEKTLVKLDIIKNSCLFNVQTINKNISAIISNEENKRRQKASKKKQKKKAQSIADEKASILKRLAELENMGA